MDQILTPAQLRRARRARDISQARLAREVDVKRSYISQFECGRYNFDDVDLRRIKAFFPEIKSKPPREKKAVPLPEKKHTFRNGFLIPENLNNSYVEKLLKLFQSNQRAIKKILDEPAPKFLWLVEDDEACEKRERAVLLLMADSYVLGELLRGQRFPISREGTIGARIRKLMGLALN